MSHNGRTGQLLFELIKCLLASLCPVEWDILPSQVDQRLGLLGVVSAESPVIISPRKAWTSVGFLGVGHSATLLTFSSKGLVSSALMWNLASTSGQLPKSIVTLPRPFPDVHQNSYQTLLHHPGK